MRTPRRQPNTSSTPTTSIAPRPVAFAVITILALGLAGCAPPDPTPLPTVSPSGPTTTVLPTPATTTTTVQPTPITTTIGGPTPITTTIGRSPSPASTVTVPATTQWTFIVVRHANWADDGTEDPPLTEAGEIRARRLADLLSSRPGVAVYATSHRRAQDTARPTAVVWDLHVTTYDGDLTPAALVSQIRQQHPAGLIVIVGHSDTVPGIVAELCRCRVDPIPENDYATLFRVVLQSDGAVLDYDRTSY